MKFYIWGTGYIAQRVKKNGIFGELLGYIETERTKTQYQGYQVYDRQRAKMGGYDYIIVANTFSDEIYETCLQEELDINKIVFLIKGKNTKFYINEEIRQILGEKNCIEYAAEYRTWKGTFIEDDIQRYEAMNKRETFQIKEEYMHPCIFDKYAMNSGMNVYFWQDLWGARHIISNGIKEHWDIGSRVDGFIAHLLAADIKVNVIDIRPFPGTVENLYTTVDDATMLNQFQDNSIPSLSALCSIEHFGLGRYGDPVDPEACFQCFAQIQKKLKPGGKLYISLPVGQDRVEFNAHRVFFASTILSCFKQLKLLEYSVIDGNKIEYHVDINKYDEYEKKHVTGLFMFEKQ